LPSFTASMINSSVISSVFVAFCNYLVSRPV
jgi:hypothetical protein